VIPALMPTYNRADLAFERGEGAWLWTADGRRFLDFGAGIATASLGHGHPHLVRAIAEQAAKVMHTSNLYRIPQAERLAARLVETSFADSVFFCNSGAEANEGMLKAVRKFHAEEGRPERFATLCFEGAFHGRTLATLAATGNEKYLAGFGPPAQGFRHVPFGNMNAVRDAIDGTTAAVLVEPIQGEGGVVIPPADYLPGLRALCDERQMLLICDEIQSGLGRTGRTFAVEHVGVEPDLYLLGKALGGGVVPVSAVVGNADVLGVLHPGQHGSTFGGNPLAAAVGLSVVRMLADGSWQHRATELGSVLADGLRGLIGQGVTAVRCVGLWAGVDIDPALGTGREVSQRLMARGILVKDTHGSTIRLAPPLVVTAEELTWAVEQLREVLAELH
jgi:acetylornithine/N-succinyldiaminopimelate aminotransferase